MTNTKKESADMHSQAVKQEGIVYLLSIVGFFFIFFTIYGTSDYDNNKIENNKTEVVEQDGV